MWDDKRIVVLPILDKFHLELEQSLFKMAMVANLPWTMELPQIDYDLSKPLFNPITKL